MKYSEKVRSFIGVKGRCAPAPSGVFFDLRESHKALGFIDTIEEVGDDFAVINYASDMRGASFVLVPLDRLEIYY